MTRLDPALVPPGRPFTLMRAHAACCGTPLFNTWRELPSISFFAAAAVADGGSGAAALLQPPEWRLNTRWSTVPPETLPPPAGSPTFDPRFLARFVARNVLYGRRGAPAPFELPTLEGCAVRPRAGATGSVAAGAPAPPRPLERPR